jgi:hypothetical protein
MWTSSFLLCGGIKNGVTGRVPEKVLGKVTEEIGKKELKVAEEIRRRFFGLSSGIRLLRRIRYHRRFI